MPISVLPDEVLLAVFDFCMDMDHHPTDDLLLSVVDRGKRKKESWQRLVHVCRHWRSLVFGSPRRLDLHLVCTTKTPAMDTLDIWPPLPLIIWWRGGDLYWGSVENVIAVLEHSDRVRRITLRGVPNWLLGDFSDAMQATFPELTCLEIDSFGTAVPALPDSFLGGSAPRLESLWLERIPFPGLPNLLMSAPRLVGLRLDDIPHPGYISPEAMVTALSTLTRLGSLSLALQPPQSHPGQASRRAPPPTRSVLPALTYFCFKGATEYLEDLVARIDVPRLDDLNLILFYDQVVFDAPQFAQFVSRTPQFKALEKARIIFKDVAASIKFSSRTSGYRRFYVKIPCAELDWQVSSLQNVCNSWSPPLSSLEDLYIYEAPHSRRWHNIASTPWLELLHPFTAVKNLYLTEEFAPRIIPALQELVGDRTTEVLPALRNMFIEGFEPGPAQEGIRQFVDARLLAGHHVAFSRWDRKKRVEKVDD